LNQSVLPAIYSWQDFYRELFGLNLDLSTLRIPAKPKGDGWRLLVIAEGLTNNKVFAKCKELFPCWKYWDNLDEITSERNPRETYALWVRDRQEADEELKNLSANDLKERNIQTETMLERLIHGFKYFKETNQRLDTSNWTLCAGSRRPGGSAPGVDWRDGGMDVLWYDPDDRDDCIRARLAVS
jgi:hypothetical protein